MRACVFFSLCLVANCLNAEIKIIDLSKDAKSAHLSLDASKKYKVGDVINFYKNRKLVSKGALTYVTPKQTKAIVKLTHGASLSRGLMVVASPQINKAVIAKKSKAQNYQNQNKQPQAERSPASLSTSSMSQLRNSHQSFSRSTTQDLLYFPEAQSFLVGLAGEYQQETVKIENFDEIKTGSLILSTGIIYAPLNHLSLGLGLSFANETIDQGNDSDSASGLEDPELLFSYRFLDLESDPLQLVLNLEISPSLGKSDDSNVLRGNHKVGLGLAMGKRHGAWTWNLGPELCYFTETKNDNEALDSDSFFAIGLNGELQVDLNERWALNSPVFVKYFTEEKAKDDSFKIKSYYMLGAGFGFKFAPSETLNIFSNFYYVTVPSLTLESSGASSSDGDLSRFGFLLGMNHKF